MAETEPIEAALGHLEQSIQARKCHVCGCQQGTVRALMQSLDSLSTIDRARVEPTLKRAQATFGEQRYDCLGCTVCYPSLVAQELAKVYPDLALEEGCATDLEQAEERAGWPPVPGSYSALRYHAPVAVCTLNSSELLGQLKAQATVGLSIVGTLHTENLGIERIIRNVQANPNIRHLVVAGKDTEQRIGHLPGASLLSLFSGGVDERGRIVGAPGRRPVLKNVGREDVERFRRQVEVYNLVGQEDPVAVLEVIQQLASRNTPAFGEIMAKATVVETFEAENTQPLVLDENGYFVIDADMNQQEIRVEHYSGAGLLDKVVKGKDVSAIYMTAIREGMLSRLDHAAYLGKELTRAAVALAGGKGYVQDKAQEPECDVQGDCGNTNGGCR